MPLHDISSEFHAQNLRGGTALFLTEGNTSRWQLLGKQTSIMTECNGQRTMSDETQRDGVSLMKRQS